MIGLDADGDLEKRMRQESIFIAIAWAQQIPGFLPTVVPIWCGMQMGGWLRMRMVMWSVTKVKTVPLSIAVLLVSPFGQRNQK